LQLNTTFTDDIIDFKEQQRIIEKRYPGCHEKLEHAVDNLQTNKVCMVEVNALSICLFKLYVDCSSTLFTSAYQNFGLYAWYKKDIFLSAEVSERTIKSFSKLSVPGFNICVNNKCEQRSINNKQ